MNDEEEEEILPEILNFVASEILAAPIATEDDETVAENIIVSTNLAQAVEIQEKINNIESIRKTTQQNQAKQAQSMLNKNKKK